MTDAELKKAVDAIAKRYSDLNIRYIRQIAEQIKAIGELNPKSLNQIAEMLRMNANLSEIVAELQRLTELTKQDVRAIMQRITEDAVMDARYLPYYAEQSGLPESEITPALAKQYAGAEAQERLRRMTLAMAAQTDDRLDNLSNTTALAEPYRQAVDRAVLAVSENVTSYTEAMRDTVRELGHAGMQVQYESGWHRRLDTAVRQNILDATGQLAQTAAITVGEALNYNAFEISAHAMSAPDHEPVQGHVFLTDEFYKLQQNQPSQDADGQQFDAIRRPIKEWNCGHFAFPFDTRFSKRKYTPEQLQKFIDDNKAGCVIGQKRYTLYEASQIMRRIECGIRREKDTAVAAQAAGDDQLRVDCQLRINHLSGLYKQVTDASGLTPRRERMTVEGFRRAKVPENAEKVLTSAGGSDKIASEESPRKSKQGSFEVDWSKIQSAEYSAKFRKLSDNPTVSDALETRAKWALNNRSGKQTEELYAVSMTSGKEIARITDQNIPSGIERTTQFTAKLDEADLSGDKIMLLHNHPRGLPPSISDINALLKNKNVSGITIGHNGTVYRYTRPDRAIPEDDWIIEMRKLKDFSEMTSMEKALEILSQRFGFEFERL